SWSYFRALQYYDKVPVKFVVFPGEPHGPRKLTHQMRKVEEELAWFDKYFFKTEKPANDAVKKSSPLENLMRAGSAKVHEGLYGEQVGKAQKILIPELIRRGDIEIGRFEVTRWQYLEYLSRRDAHGKRAKLQAQTPGETTSGRYNWPQSKVTID